MLLVGFILTEVQTGLNYRLNSYPKRIEDLSVFGQLGGNSNVSRARY